MNSIRALMFWTNAEVIQMKGQMAWSSRIWIPITLHRRFISIKTCCVHWRLVGLLLLTVLTLIWWNVIKVCPVKTSFNCVISPKTDLTTWPLVLPPLKEVLPPLFLSLFPFFLMLDYELKFIPPLFYCVAMFSVGEEPFVLSILELIYIMTGLYLDPNLVMM